MGGTPPRGATSRTRRVRELFTFRKVIATGGLAHGNPFPWNDRHAESDEIMTIKLFPGMPKLPGDATPSMYGDMSRYRSAALHARRILPGPLGELAQRELNAYVEFGYGFSNDGLIPRLAAAVLATRLDSEQTLDSRTSDEVSSNGSGGSVRDGADRRQPWTVPGP
jgi:hypothetical protein